MVFRNDAGYDIFGRIDTPFSVVYVQTKRSWVPLEQLIEITTYQFSLCVGDEP